MCYTYDNLSRVTARTVKKLSDNSVVSTETFNYDAAGNVTSAPDSSFQYDTNNRLISFNGNTVSYDLDGNMLSNGSLSCSYDSANRLVSAGGHTYTYNAEDVRIRNCRPDTDTTYVYDTNCKLSKLLCKTTNGITTKYVYGLGLIGEEKCEEFKTYHFDFRGSTVALTDEACNIIDTFAYDTYGKCVSHIGSSFVIFGYNGRDGVVTDVNGLIYMRARYYSPDMRRFINADIIPGELSNAITLNRFAYANGNPVSYTDPFGLSVLPWQSMPYKNLEKEKKRLINACEKLDSLKRAGLQIESFFNQGYSNFLFTSSLSGILLNVGHDHINLHYNKALEETNDYIYFQEKVSFKLGVHDFSWCGCEVVAVYNAMKAANYSPSVADIVLEFQENGVIIGNHLVSGALGGNPYSISKALDAMDVKYKSIPLEQMTENSSYILSYWNYPNSINPSIHTIAIVKTKDGYATYNYKRNPTFQNIDEIVKQFGDAFITAYQIVERK